MTDQNQLKAERAKLIERADKSRDVRELRKIYDRVKTINNQLATLRADDDEDDRTKAIREYEELKENVARSAEQPPHYTPGAGFTPASERSKKSMTEIFTDEQRKKAGDDLKENRAAKFPASTFGELRAVTINPPSGESASIVVPSHYSNTINSDFPAVSSIVDAVGHLSLPGGESFTQPYITGIDRGSYTNEGAAAATAETRFDFVQMNRAKVTAYCEITEELDKLPSADYAAVVFDNIRTSMRQLIAEEIMIGKGVGSDDSPRLVGIFSDKATAIDPATDISISEITDTTLDDIIFKYGGDVAVESPAFLILNKKDLLAFSKVRTSTKEKFYDIKLNGNSGTISGVPFILNSACKAITDPATASGDFCMCYGYLNAYTLCEFSQSLVVEKSTDFKFPSGIRAFRGVAFIGGNVTKKNAFLRIKKK